MLGVTQNPHEDPADQMLRELGEEMGVGDTYKRTPVGIYFGDRGKTVSDPYFDGEGPDRTGCHLCGQCMIGCRHGAKNTLVKNYLYLAEKRGTKVMPERTVIDIRPIGPADGSEGYEVESVRSGAWLNKERRVQRARGVIVSAGALGTNKLLQRCRLKGSLPRISDRLGELVRTNSESILTVTVPEDYHEDLIKRVAITSSIYPDPDTHIETVTYGDGGDSMRILYTLMVGDGTRVTRPLKLLAQIVMHPGRLAKILFPKHWSRRTIIILVMQTLDNAIALRPRTGPFGSFWLQTEQDAERPNPTFIPAGNRAAEWFAKRTGGIAQSSVMEATLNIPTTAHILGGAVIGSDPSRGVVDARQHVFGYENLLVVDGSAVPANVGVNPSLTITALAEHAMSRIPAAARATPSSRRPSAPSRRVLSQAVPQPHQGRRGALGVRACGRAEHLLELACRAFCPAEAEHPQRAGKGMGRPRSVAGPGFVLAERQHRTIDRLNAPVDLIAVAIPDRPEHRRIEILALLRRRRARGDRGVHGSTHQIDAGNGRRVGWIPHPG